MSIPGLVPGRFVTYVPSSADGFEEERAAIVVRVSDKENGVVSLHVLLDGRNDGYILEGVYQNVKWQPKVPYSETGEPRSWHWPVKE